MSCAKIDPALHQAQKPPWIKVRLPSNPVFFSTKALISDLRLHTVCESAQCPNRWECWSQGTATFMIAGDRCTRACGFCAVTTAKPFALEGDEPEARRRSSAPDEFEACRYHRGRARRSERWRRTSFRADDHYDSPNGSFNHHRSARSGFSRTGLVHPDRARRWPGHLQSQHGNSRTAHSRRAFARKVSDIVASFAACKGTVTKRGHKERRDARSWRKGDGTFSDHGRFARGRLRSLDHRSVLAPKSEALAGR